MQIPDLKIPLSSNKKKGQRLILILLLLISGLLMVYFAISATNAFFKTMFAAGGGINLLAVGYFFRNNAQTVLPAIVMLILNSILWLISGNWLVAFMFLVTAAALHFMSKTGYINLTKQGVYLPIKENSFYMWNQVDSVLLRDRLITFNLNSDRTFQFEIDKDWNIEALEHKISELRNTP